MKKLIFILLFVNCVSTKYHVETRQFGLSESNQIPVKNIIKIDTVYNSSGGVVKIITYKQKE
jgi:hypothetical protein